MKKIIQILVLFLLLSANQVNANIQISDILEEGETKQYTFNDVVIEIYVLIIYDVQPPFTTLKINGNLTGHLSVNDTYFISNQIKLSIKSLDSCNSGMGDCIEILLSDFPNTCSNSFCDSEEDCSTCLQDCGCASGYKCENKQCVEVVSCGDNKCSSGETCPVDNCCNGVSINLNADINNCGGCGTKCFSNNQTCSLGNCVSLTAYCRDLTCDANENCGSCANDCKCAANTKCEDSKCITYCGNGICESNEESQCKADCKWCGDGTCSDNENYTNCLTDCSKSVVCGDSVCDSSENRQNCCKDCSCNSGFSCIDNNCISHDKCSSNSDCNDNNTCTDDVCSGMPKKCTNNMTIGCLVVNNNTNKLQPEINNMSSVENKTVVNQVATNDDSIDTNENQDAGIINTIINWFKELFGIN